MSRLAEHPTVRRHAERRSADGGERPVPFDAGELRRICLGAGADDVGFVEIDRAEIASQRAEIVAAFPRAKTLVAFVRRMNRENIRTPARSVSNLEFHNRGDEIDDIGQRIVAALEARGIRAMNPAMGFPMEMDRWPGRAWVVSHKPVAVAAGLGQMGIHRNVIHPKFGNFILLGTVITEADVSEHSRPVDYNPCLECKLCVAACPTGAIAPDGHFDFAACYTHNYREFMGGFGDWVETAVESKDVRSYRRKVSDAETVSVWQSLSFGPNYKAAYCMAVCPAGDDVVAPFLENRREFLDDVVEPLTKKVETIYVVPGSDAEGYVARRFPHKRPKRVANGLRPSSIAGFLRALPITFQRHQAGDLAATFHFTFTGEEAAEATVRIENKTIKVTAGHVGQSDLSVVADGAAWLAFVRRESSIGWALVRRKIRISGPLSLLKAFGRCFPS